MVVAAPSATSATPILRRRRAGIFPDSRRPAPKPKAARVATMKPNTGNCTVSLFFTGHPHVWPCKRHSERIRLNTWLKNDGSDRADDRFETQLVVTVASGAALGRSARPMVRNDNPATTHNRPADQNAI